MTFEINVRQIRIDENGNWKADIELGDNYFITVECNNNELSSNSNIKQEPVSYDTILDQVQAIIGETNIPDIETGKYGDIE
jgi:hypothetical protein